MAAVARNYNSIGCERSDLGREAACAKTIDALWTLLSGTGVSWIGVYFGPGQKLSDGRAAGPDEMILGPCRNKPACSPIGLHGACGRAWRERRALIVTDVKKLGSNYVACDPRDRSELVIPLFEPSGACWGVLDADSHEPGAFNEQDAAELTAITLRCGLSAPQTGTHPPLTI